MRHLLCQPNLGLDWASTNSHCETSLNPLAIGVLSTVGGGHAVLETQLRLAERNPPIIVTVIVTRNILQVRRQRNTWNLPKAKSYWKKRVAARSNYGSRDADAWKCDQPQWRPTKGCSSCQGTQPRTYCYINKVLYCYCGKKLLRVG